MVGTNFPYSEWLPEPGQARGVQIDIDGGCRHALSARRALVGDAAETLGALLAAARAQAGPQLAGGIEANVRRWWDILDGRAHQPADPINPQLVFHELSPRLPDRVVLTTDAGSATNWWARHLKVRDDMKAILSGTLATMCPAVPYAVGAKFAHPDRPVIAAIGDGAMQMLGINA